MAMNSRTSRRSTSPKDNLANQDDQHNLTWIMITNPHQSKDKDMMRNVRIQVMNDYLTKERRNPHSTDARVRHTVKRSRTSTSPELKKKSGPHTTRSQSPPRARDSAVGSCRPSPEITYAQTYQESEAESLGDTESTMLAPCAAYDAPVAGIGAKLDVFNATPKFDGEHIDVLMLKHNCTTYFASQAMCKKWVPMLFAGRAAFLSTLCISSAYLDMMQMDFTVTRTANSIESVRTLTVREQTVKLIGERLSDPETCCNDANIVSVVHLLFGEMIVAGSQALQWHEDGLHTMVEYRGGLDNLGGNGLLAAMVTIQTFEVSVLRENRPRQQYLDYARSISGPSARERSSAMPESPLYYPTGLHHTLARTQRCNEETLDLINLVRDLTQAVMDLEDASAADAPHGEKFGPKAASKIYTELEVQALHRKKQRTTDQIVALEARDDPVYEAIRLCALLYATAIHCNMPLSTTARSFPSRIVLQIRDNLLRTDLSNCWDSMVGMLFWCTIVTGAACNNADPEDIEVLATKKWMVALAIRSSILLIFQHTDAMVRMLRTILVVQKVLRGSLEEAEI
ncbi:hypothetical protein E4T49_02964 [Aureobasidium sp. EXF-10728]|nr:hypothetical protein E4T49_02964 [Aureobasidium sp. EXF-10728]